MEARFLSSPEVGTDRRNRTGCFELEAEPHCPLIVTVRGSKVMSLARDYRAITDDI